MKKKMKGIKTSKDKSTYFIGNFEDGSMEGYSIILDSDGLFSANAINNKFYDLREMGFAGSEESEEIETHQVSNNENLFAFILNGKYSIFFSSS